MTPKCRDQNCIYAFYVFTPKQQVEQYMGIWDPIT